MPVSRLRRVLTYVYVAALAAAVAAVIAAPLLEQTEVSSTAAAIPNLLILLITVLMLAGTLLFLVVAPLRVGTRAAAAAAILLPAVGLAAATERVDWSGDMWPTFQTDAEAVADYGRPAADADAGDATQAPLPTPSRIDAVEYRGPARDGRVDPAALPVDFPEGEPLAELWERPMGPGYAGISVLGDFVLTLDQAAGDEVVLCLDASDGSVRWADAYPARFSEAMGGDGPRSTPTISRGRVFSYGATGILTASDLRTGTRLWQTDTLGDLGLPVTYWGMCSSPLVIGAPWREREVVAVTVGGPNPQKANGLALYDAATGELVAKSDRRTEPFSPGDFPDDGEQESNAAGYSSPMLATLGGVDLILNYDGFGLRGHALDDARELFFFEATNGPRVNVGQPIVIGDDRVFISSSYDTGASLLRIVPGDPAGDAWTVEPLWTSQKLRLKFASAVERDGYLYGLDEGILTCLDAADGRRRWKRGRYQHGQLVLAGQWLVLQAEDGRLVAVRAVPDRFEEAFSQEVLGASRNWNPPTIAGGAVYMRNHQRLVKLGR